MFEDEHVLDAVIGVDPDLTAGVAAGGDRIAMWFCSACPPKALRFKAHSEVVSDAIGERERTVVAHPRAQVGFAVDQVRFHRSVRGIRHALCLVLELIDNLVDGSCGRGLVGADG